MAVKKTIEKDMIPEIEKKLKDLQDHRLRVGVFGKDDSLMAKIAGTHEFGADIKPKKSKFLIIPLNSKAKKSRPREIKDLWSLKVGNDIYLVKDKGKNDLEFYYLLTRHVKIPERSFIRAGYDENKHKLFKKNEREIRNLLMGKIDLDQYYKIMGEYSVSMTKRFMTKLKNPPKSSITLASNPRKNNPLIDSGRLRNSVVWKKERR